MERIVIRNRSRFWREIGHAILGNLLGRVTDEEHDDRLQRLEEIYLDHRSRQ